VSRKTTNLFAKERIPQRSEVFAEMFGKIEIDQRVETVMSTEGTKWTKKNHVGLRAKIAKEVWEEADEETKQAVQTKIAGIIADRRKESNVGTRGAKQFHE
jgi:hypothetical protein